MPNQTPLITQGKKSGKWYIVTEYILFNDAIHAYEKFDATDRILEIITEAGFEVRRLHEALTKAGEDIKKIRNELVEQERVNEELGRELAVLKHLGKEQAG